MKTARGGEGIPLRPSLSVSAFPFGDTPQRPEKSGVVAPDGYDANVRMVIE